MVLRRNEFQSASLHTHNEIRTEENGGSLLPPESIVGLLGAGRVDRLQCAGQDLVAAVADVRLFIHLARAFGRVYLGAISPTIAPCGTLMASRRQADRVIGSRLRSASGASG